MTLIGTMIDATYVQGQNPNIKNVTQADLAKAALQAQESNQQAAMTLVNSFKEDYGNGVSTLVMLYNATGAELALRSSDDSSGHIGKYPYDLTIQNGQWSVFLHVHTSGTAGGSVGAVGYNVEDGNTKPVAVVAWDNPYSGSPKAFGDCWGSDTYAKASWDFVYTRADQGGTSGTSGVHNGYFVPYSIGQTSSPIFQASFQMAT